MKLLCLLLCMLLSSHCFKYNWTKPEDLNVGLPPSVQIFTLNMGQSPFGTKLTGGFARFNMSDPNLEFVVRDQNEDMFGYTPKTPQQYANAQKNVVYAVLNGGYFNMQLNISSSFVAEKGIIINKNDINSNANNHPTVGAFGLTKNRTFETEYVYSFGDNLETYKYRLPNPYPGPPPTKTSGQLWNVQEGIGAGPILIKNNSIIKGNVQNFGQSSMIDFRHPRSAVCVDHDNRLYFVAIDGRYAGSDGMKMPELADLMQDLFCVDAMNLDGGGSTCLYANKKIINRPSDASGPRPVVTAILVIDRNKKKQENLLK